MCARALVKPRPSHCGGHNVQAGVSLVQPPWYRFKMGPEEANDGDFQIKSGSANAEVQSGNGDQLHTFWLQTSVRPPFTLLFSLRPPQWGNAQQNDRRPKDMLSLWNPWARSISLSSRTMRARMKRRGDWRACSSVHHIYRAKTTGKTSSLYRMMKGIRSWISPEDTSCKTSPTQMYGSSRFAPSLLKHIVTSYSL